MPVNLAPPSADQLLPVKGVRLGTAEAGVRKANRRDLTIIELAPGSSVAGVFTQNRFCAAPVQICQRQLSAGGDIRLLLINTGNANAGTGEQGLQNAVATCEEAAKLFGVSAQAVLPFSTGVILEHLPVERIVAGLPAAKAALVEDGWHAAAHAIMTTDTVAKAISKQVHIDGKTVTVTGMSKGAGMIKPNMATMLGFLATDAAVPQVLLQKLAKEAADFSFNSITVDGDTSTNDSFILMATGQAGVQAVDEQSSQYQALRQAVLDVSVWLAQAIVRDGEGATKFMSIMVEGGRDREECRKVGYAVAHSPLVKTAFFASDPNLGRILAAVGYAGISDLDVSGVRVWLGSGNEQVQVADKGGRMPSYREEDGARIMKNAEISVRIDLNRGAERATIWTCDFSYDYVKINADYRS